VALITLGWLWWRAWGPLVARDAAALCVAGEAGVALGDMDLRFAWQVWHLATFRVAGMALMVAPGGALHGTWQHRPSAGVALCDIHLGWLWWRAWRPLVARDAAALCVVGVALGDIDLRFAWRLVDPLLIQRGNHAWLHSVHESSCHVLILIHRGKKSGMLCKDLRCLKLYRHVWILTMRKD